MDFLQLQVNGSGLSQKKKRKVNGSGNWQGVRLVVSIKMSAQQDWIAGMGWIV